METTAAEWKMESARRSRPRQLWKTPASGTLGSSRELVARASQRPLPCKNHRARRPPHSCRRPEPPAQHHVSRLLPPCAPSEACHPGKSSSSPLAFTHRLSPGPYCTQFFRNWTPSLGLWGAGAGITALYVRGTLFSYRVPLSESLTTE